MRGAAMPTSMHCVTALRRIFSIFPSIYSADQSPRNKLKRCIESCRHFISCRICHFADQLSSTNCKNRVLLNRVRETILARRIWKPFEILPSFTVYVRTTRDAFRTWRMCWILSPRAPNSHSAGTTILPAQTRSAKLWQPLYPWFLSLLELTLSQLTQKSFSVQFRGHWTVLLNRQR